MEVKVITDIVGDVVPLQVVKNYLRIDEDYTHDDVNLGILMASARQKLEKFTNLSFGKKTLQVQFDQPIFELPYGPVDKSSIQIETVETTPEAITDFKITGLNFPTIYLDNFVNAEFFYPINQGIPQIWSGNFGCGLWNVTYNAGYGQTTTGGFPIELTHALLLQIDHDFKHLGRADAGISQVALEKAFPFSRNLTIQ